MFAIGALLTLGSVSSSASRQARSDVRARCAMSARDTLQDDLRRVYSATSPASRCGAEPSLRSSIREAYEPRQQPAASTPSAHTIEKLLDRAKSTTARPSPTDPTDDANPLPEQILGSQWTRISSVDGGVESKALVSVLKLGLHERRLYAQVAAVSSFGAGQGLTAWVPLVELRNPARWRPGWLTLPERAYRGPQGGCPARSDGELLSLRQ